MKTELVVNFLIDWLKERVNEAGAQGVVLGLSGGIDSAVAGVLAKKAFDNNCLGVILPCQSSLTDIIHAKRFAEDFDIPFKIIELDNSYNMLVAELDTHFNKDSYTAKLAKANIKPRLRMLTLYYAAQMNNFLVLGTSNKSEIKVGYSTKYGDQGVDLQILADLVKHEVYEIAEYLKVPSFIINKSPSAGLWEGQTDEKEMGISYQELDQYIETGQAKPEVMEIIEKLSSKGEHKRKMPPQAIIPQELRRRI